MKLFDAKPLLRLINQLGMSCSFPNFLLLWLIFHAQVQFDSGQIRLCNQVSILCTFTIVNFLMNVPGIPNFHLSLIPPCILWGWCLEGEELF